MNNKLTPNTTQIPNILLDEWMTELSATEFKIVMIIARQTYGWHKDSDAISYSQLKIKTGASNGSIGSSLKSLREKGLIQVLDENDNILTSKEECRGKVLYYRINVTSPKTGDDLSKNRTPKIGDTKETNTKTLTNVRDDAPPKGRTSCPLSVSPLKEKWPNGHPECVSFVNSSGSFVNKPKQFRFVHQMLRVGLDFPDIEKIITRVEKKPYFQENGWDFATIASEADRRINARP